MTLRTIHSLLAERARQSPDAPFVRFAGHDQLTFADIEGRANALAAGLARCGVARGDLVPLMMPNRAEFVVSWFAINKLGAVATFINTTMRGPALAHAINLSEAELGIVDASLLASLSSVVADLHRLRCLVVLGQSGAATTGPLELLDFDSLAAEAQPVATAELPPVAASDPAIVMFTSGTTGPSKGCLLSHRYVVRNAELMIENLRLRPDDVLYCPFPLFHLDASVLTVMPALVMGGRAAIGDRFSVSGFWTDVRSVGATVFDFMGATLSLLEKVPPRADDLDNTVRLAWGVPVPEFADDFEKRFGLQLVELYGSTDAGVPIYHPVDEPRRAGSCGKVLAQYEVELFDDDGVPVPIGDVGEIVIRPNEPSIMSSGYFGMPEATLRANRNLWFHTGDLARRDADGFFYFVGRRTESIRRRGENISAFEIEEVVKLHPDVLDAAAFGVPSELTEDDVMVALVPRPGRVIDPSGVIDFCVPRMARHMLPRYIDIVEDLPRTPTEKVEKRFLVEQRRHVLDVG